MGRAGTERRTERRAKRARPRRPSTRYRAPLRALLDEQARSVVAPFPSQVRWMVRAYGD